MAPSQTYSREIPLAAADRVTSIGGRIAACGLQASILQPRILLGSAARLLSLWTETAASSLTGDASLSLRDTANKLSAWRLFAWADVALGRPVASLADAARAASAGDPFESVWTLEGAGYAFARSALHRPGVVGLLRTGEADRLPESVLLPLHTGLGLALAEMALESGASQSIGEQVADFLSACSLHAREDWTGIVFEALGFIAVEMRRSRVREIDCVLSSGPAELREYFWHGAGRGCCFTPGSFVPDLYLRAPAFQALAAIATDTSARRNLEAGFAWAETLVNIRHPAVLMYAIGRMRRDAAESTIANGVSSALHFWRKAAKMPADSTLFESSGIEADSISPAPASLFRYQEGRLA